MEVRGNAEEAADRWVGGFWEGDFEEVVSLSHGRPSAWHGMFFLIVGEDHGDLSENWDDVVRSVRLSLCL